MLAEGGGNPEGAGDGSNYKYQLRPCDELCA